MAEYLQIVELNAANETVPLLNLNDEENFFLESKSFKVVPGARTAIVAQDQRRWGGGRQVGETQENCVVEWTAGVAGENEQECLEKVGALLAQLSANPLPLWLLWLQPGVGDRTLYEIRETGTWTCNYDWATFAGASLCLFTVQIPVGPLACGLPVQVYSNSGLTLPTTISLATIPGDAPAKAEVSIETGVITPEGSFITGTDKPQGIAVDATHIYWTNFGSGTIGRALLNGTNVEESWITGATGPTGIAVNASYVYWTNYSANSIGRATIAGGGVNQSFMTGLEKPGGLAIDSAHIYFTNVSTGHDIGRATLAGGTIEKEWIKGFGLTEGPRALAVDATYIYWTQPFQNTIGRCLLTEPTLPNHTWITGASSPTGLGVTSGYIYWLNNGTQYVGRAPTAGGEVNQSWLGGIGSNAEACAVTSEDLYWGDVTSGAIGRADYAVTAHPPIWALLGWATKPTTGLAPAPLGILDSNAATPLEGWEKQVAEGGYGTEQIYGETLHGGASWEVDPATMVPDSFSGELTIEVWARMFVLSSLVTAQVTLSAQPQDGLGYGAARYTDEWGSQGRPITLPSTSGYRLTRLGTLHLLVNALAPRIWKLVVEGTAGVAAADWGIDYVLVVPSLQRACSPSSKPYNSSYPAFITNVGATVKTIRHNLSALISKPGKNGHPDHGLGGQLLELPPGETDLVVKLSNMVPDSPQVTVTFDQPSYTGAVTVTVTPRWFLARTN